MSNASPLPTRSGATPTRITERKIRTVQAPATPEELKRYEAAKQEAHAKGRVMRPLDRWLRVTRAKHDLLDEGVQRSLTKLAYKVRKKWPILRAHEIEDMVQQALTLALERLHQFSGRSSLKTWVCSLARNKFTDMARRAAIRPTPGGDLFDSRSGGAARSVNLALREQMVDLVAWLRDEYEDCLPHASEVLTLLINSRGNWDYVSQAMTAWTKQPWTPDCVKRMVRQISETPKGAALVSAPVLRNMNEEEAA